MSEFNDPKTSAPPGTPVPDLIEQYRLRRDAWIAQADELARLRDEVRGSAEREAMEIVTAARRDVRQRVMEARRELLVLSAQVQAALGEAGATPEPTALLNRGRDDDRSIGEASAYTDPVFAPEEAVKGMLDEARADMDALVEEARTVPFEALTNAPALPPPPTPSELLESELLETELLQEEPFIAAPPSTPTSLFPPPSSSHHPSRSLQRSLRRRRRCRRQRLARCCRRSSRATRCRSRRAVVCERSSRCLVSSASRSSSARSGGCVDAIIRPRQKPLRD
jgi:hypothetical protein